MTTNVKFTRQTGPYRTHEVAGFDDVVAERIIASGAGVKFLEQPHPDNDYRARGHLMPDTVGQRLPLASASAREIEQQVTDAGLAVIGIPGTATAQGPAATTPAKPAKAAAQPKAPPVPRGGRLGDAARAPEPAVTA